MRSLKVLLIRSNLKNIPLKGMGNGVGFSLSVVDSMVKGLHNTTVITEAKELSFWFLLRIIFVSVDIYLQ